MKWKLPKEAVRLLISNANDTKDKLENLIKIATNLENNIEEQKKKIIEINKFAENTKKEIVILNNASAQIALILVRQLILLMRLKVSLVPLEQRGLFRKS